MSLYGANEGISHTQKQGYPLLGILIGISLFRDIPAFVLASARISHGISVYRDVLCFVMGHPGTYPMQYPTGCPYIDIYCCRHPMGYCTIETRISSVLDRMSAFFTRISYGISHGISVIFIFWGSIFACSFPE